MSELSEEDYIDTYDGDNGSECRTMNQVKNGTGMRERTSGDVCMVVCIGYVVLHLETSLRFSYAY